MRRADISTVASTLQRMKDIVNDVVREGPPQIPENLLEDLILQLRARLGGKSCIFFLCSWLLRERWRSRL